VTRDLGRREFLGWAGTVAAGAVLAGCSSGAKHARIPATSTPTTGLPTPETAPFDTVVSVMMENRSFDHLLGWLPGADGKQAGLSYTDATGAVHSTYALAPDFQGCASHDPKHDWQSVAKQFNNGKCDGFLRTQPLGDMYPIGYYTGHDLPVLRVLAQNHTTCDNYHCSVLGPTGPNRMYAWCGTTDYLQWDPILTGKGPRPSHIDLTIFDRLHDANVPALYYAGIEPHSYSFSSKRYDAITRPHAEFFAAAKNGTLPRVSFLDPDLDSIGEFVGTATDDHPYGDLRVGEQWLGQVYRALASSPQWNRLVLIITFDEHGGFYDHVVPPTVVDDTKLSGPAPDFTRTGFRVPCIIGGPFAPARVVHSGPYEHCSILRMIEWRWGLEPMRARDAHAQNLANALDFSVRRPPVKLAAYTAPPVKVCTPAENTMHVTS
jgi:phospholipase C